jgi:glycosyltransferase involved in cell wall biosynthesis
VALAVADGNDADLSSERLPIFDLGGLDGGQFRRALLGTARSLRFIRRAKPSVVHFHDPELIVLGFILKVIGYKVIYDVHEDVPKQILTKDWIPKATRSPLAMATGMMEAIAASVFDAIVLAVPAFLERFPSHKTVVVQNFPIQDEFRMPESAPYGQRPPAFAYVGGISRIRGAREMVRALGYLKHRPDVGLELAGRFEPASLREELERLPSWSAVTYHGRLNRPAVAALLGHVRAGLVVLHPVPNYLEAYPVKMFEYMAAGLPVIASDFPLWRRVVSEARCGLLVDPMDPKSIADAMFRILERPDEAERMGRNGRKAVEETYSWDRESAKLIALYKKLFPERAG